MRPLALLLFLLGVAAARPAPLVAAVVPAVFGGRIACAPADDVQLCAGDVGHRVESWDGVPLDVNLTLPAAAVEAPYPLIVDLHGWSLAKQDAPFAERARRGYAVLSYTARGFHASCGTPAARASDPSLADPDVCARRGWTHLADARYEGHDTQYLVGLLVDAGLVDPARIGVTGASYGGGQSMLLAALRDRTMLPDGSLVPWTSPAGQPLAIAAAAPLIPWSDLAEALTPAGRTLDYRDANPYGTRVGVQKESWVHALYAVGATTGFYAPAGVDPGADLTGWNGRLDAGEPYDGDSAAPAIIGEITAHHSAYYVDDAVPPAPLLIYNAWTDDLFPADEALRFWRRTRARHADADVALQFADGFGHPRANLASPVGPRTLASVEAFLDHHLLGRGAPPPAVQTWTQGCNGAPEEGPFVADGWDALHPGEVRWVAPAAQRFAQGGGDPAVAKAVDPLAGGPCRTVPAVDDPGAATYRLPPATGAGYTLLGAPTVVADLVVAGSYAQVAARLWDVAPDGKQTLVAHALYRPRSDNAGPQPFQLHPNGWHFLAGHAPKLELLGQSVPYGRAATGEFAVEVRALELRLPVRERPDGGVVAAPAPPVLPPAAAEPPDSGPPPCATQPQAGCVAASRGTLALQHGRTRTRDALVWAWHGRDAAPWGDPAGTTAYRLCVYDGAPSLRASLPVGAGGTCAHRKGAEPCWDERGRTWTYADPQASRDGLASVALRRPRAGRAAIVLRARGEGLALPPAPIDPPLRVQLLGNRGACWDATLRRPAPPRRRTMRFTVGGR